MNIMDLASKGICSITRNYGKKIQKERTAPVIPEAQPVEFSGSGYRAGYSKAEIMPDMNSGKTYWIAGHGSGHKMEGIISPVYTSAVWLDCGDDKGILWVSADIVGLTNVEVQLVRSIVEKSGKVPKGTLLNISCTHSHSGIDTIGYWGKPNLVSIPSNGKDPEYMEMMLGKMAQVCEEAYANRKAGKLYSGSITIPGGLHPKREFKDRHEVLSRIKFVPSDGSKEIWMMNFGAHPNSLGGSNHMLSGEYPYFMREEIYKSANAEVLYGVGAIGGMDAAELDNNDNLNCVKMQGKMIADAALKISNDRELEPKIKYLRQQFYLPVGNYVLTLLAMRHVMSFTPYPYKDSNTGIAMLTEMTYMTFGDQKILLLPGENFVSTVYGGYFSAEESSTGKGPEINPIPLADIAGDHGMIAYAVTNDMTGYVVPPNDFILNPTQPFLNGYRDRFDKNHYHETNSMGIETQGIIADTFASVVKRFNK
jgi:hypothetical protein